MNSNLADIVSALFIGLPPFIRTLLVTANIKSLIGHIKVNVESPALYVNSFERAGYALKPSGYRQQLGEYSLYG